MGKGGEWEGEMGDGKVHFAKGRGIGMGIGSTYLNLGRTGRGILKGNNCRLLLCSFQIHMF